MKITRDIKSAIHAYILQELKDQLDNYSQVLKSIQESKNNETKSSAGDKFETGRAMMQMEQDKIDSQISSSMSLVQTLGTINLTETKDVAELGSLVQTSIGDYYISVSFGKVKLENNIYYGISVNAPFSQALLGKRVGDDFTINGRSGLIKEIV